MATFSLRLNMITTKLPTGITKNSPTHFTRGLMACLAGLPNTWHFAPLVQECISMATLVCAHGPTFLTNREPSELVAEHIVYALQVVTQTI